MREFYLRRIGIQKIPFRVFLTLFTCFIFINFAYSQEDSSTVSEPDSTALKVDSASVAATDTATSQENDSTLTVSETDSTMVAGSDSTGFTATDTETITPEEHPLAFEGHEGINRGKRFFLGLLPFDREYESCVSCHYMNTPDTMNWNPSAMDIALKYADKDFASFQQAVMQPTGIKMAEVHTGFTLSESDLQTVKMYLDELAHEGPAPSKPSIDRLLLFLFLGVIITLALLDLIIFHKVRRKAITVVILIAAFSYQMYMLYDEAVKLGRSQGYQPDQPIKFSHEVHATENKIDCMYCHHTAETSKSANIPSTSLCMNCHIVVREGTRSGKFEIAKLVNAYEDGRSVEWVRIHKLPDHVFFSHAQHVGAGKLDCVQCHGKIEEMHIVRQENDLSMGWCLDCHRETKVDFMDNDYYTSYKALHEELKQGLRDSVVAADIGANECQKCHY